MAAMHFAELPRIMVDPRVCTGKACIRGLRFLLARLLRSLASGQSREDILSSYPYLQAEDINEALRYPAFLADDEMVELTR
jgi:uncharacterized protein (DUF433 family)